MTHETPLRFYAILHKESRNFILQRFNTKQSEVKWGPGAPRLWPTQRHAAAWLARYCKGVETRKYESDWETGHTEIFAQPVWLSGTARNPADFLVVPLTLTMETPNV